MISSLETSTASSMLAWATSSRSKGSRWCHGNRLTASACSMLTARGTAQASSRSRVNPSGTSSLPSERLIATSQTTAALSNTRWRGRQGLQRQMSSGDRLLPAATGEREYRPTASPSAEGRGYVVWELLEVVSHAHTATPHTSYGCQRAWLIRNSDQPRDGLAVALYHDILAGFDTLYQMRQMGLRLVYTYPCHAVDHTIV
jgi:hypothetical protein